MKRKFTLVTIFISPLLFFSSSLLALNSIGQDTCTVNDFCETAIEIQNVSTDSPFVCVEGCNLNASPDQSNNLCGLDVFPTVWYRVHTDNIASFMNIYVNSHEIEAPVITLFQTPSDCGDLFQVSLTQNFIPCIVGSDGVATALATYVSINSIYYIAVSSLNSAGGKFSLCVNTISTTANCITSHEIRVTDRSDGGSLDGPFNPGERVSVCMNVNVYTGVNNGCQWFQGLVPVFGNGWDPSSFDPNGQPLNATMNGANIGQAGNGLYGQATWDWFVDVDYHYNDPFRSVLDIDDNGTVEMCSTLFDPYCPDLGGMTGGCCNPCWGAPLGTFLPPGWFAYGIDGSCPTPGPPVRVDWGDGNTCGGGMGPWRFCFDLYIREYPECLGDSTMRDLSLSFFTFTDGETGAWTGDASICAFDQPAKVRLPLSCTTQTDLGIENVENRCAGGTLLYTIDEPGIHNWTWTIYPSWAVINSAMEGDNGFVIQDELSSTVSTPVDVIYFFTGYEEGKLNTFIKQVRFRIVPDIQTSLPDLINACEKDTLVISALPLSGGQAPYAFLWSPGGETTSSIQLIPPFESGTISVHISDTIGCSYQKEIMIKVKPCQLDTIVSEDDSNETQTPDDGPIGNGKFVSPATYPISNVNAFDNSLKVYPIPATETIQVEWARDMDDATTLIIYDIRGQIVFQSNLSKSERDGHRTQINVRDYVDGVYLVLLQTEQTILTSRLLKM